MKNDIFVSKLLFVKVVMKILEKYRVLVIVGIMWVSNVILVWWVIFFDLVKI